MSGYDRFAGPEGLRGLCHVKSVGPFFCPFFFFFSLACLPRLLALSCGVVCCAVLWCGVVCCGVAYPCVHVYGMCARGRLR